MPLTGTGPVLGSAIRAAVQSAALANQGQPTNVLQEEIFKAMGEAIITHLTVTAGVGAVLGVVGVSTGGGTSGPGNLG